MSNSIDIILPASREALAELRVGQKVRLFGIIYTMRDAGHARALEHLRQYGELPYSLDGQALFYAGPTEPAHGRPFGAIGPTTASRMDFATPELLAAGINLMLGKGPRSAEVVEACVQTGSVYLVAVGGAAAYLASFVQNSELIAWEDLGTEALRKLTLNGLPAFVGIDTKGKVLTAKGKQVTGSAGSAKTAKTDKTAKTAKNDPLLSPAESDICSTADTDPAPIFITFEGGEGAGKSTQIKLLQARLKSAGYEVVCLREPGGTVVGEQIRDILLNPNNHSMNAASELLLYEAARAQLVNELIRPALAEGKVVLCDRYFDSTFAYQAYARGLDVDLVNRANAIGSVGLVPTRTIWLQRDVNHGLQKAIEDGADRLESESLEFHHKVHDGFEFLANSEPNRIKQVKCCEKKQDTADAVFKQLQDLFPNAVANDFIVTKELLQAIKDTN